MNSQPYTTPLADVILGITNELAANILTLPLWLVFAEAEETILRVNGYGLISPSADISFIMLQIIVDHVKLLAPEVDIKAVRIPNKKPVFDGSIEQKRLAIQFGNVPKKENSKKQ